MVSSKLYKYKYLIYNTQVSILLQKTRENQVVYVMTHFSEYTASDSGRSHGTLQVLDIKYLLACGSNGHECINSRFMCQTIF